MFVGNSRIESSVKLINTIEDGKFPLLLNRIAQFLCNESSSKPFTPTEEEKLEASLEVSKEEVQILINGIIEIFQVCAYYMIKPALLSEQLEQGLGVNSKKTECLVQVWAASAKGIVENLKLKSYFPQLNCISYSISVEAAGKYSAKEKTPKVQLQLGIGSGTQKKDVNLEFCHDKLYEFYKKIEQIQGQLDAFK